MFYKETESAINNKFLKAQNKHLFSGSSPRNLSALYIAIND